MNTQNENIVTVVVPEIISDPLKYKVVKDSEITLTKEKAYEFLELETFPGERQVIERHVQALFNQWAAGRFMWEHVVIATALCDRKLYRINGQHTCWMRVNVSKDIAPRVRQIEYSVSNEEQLRALYCVFDRAKSRTPAHVVRASLAGSTQAAELWPSTLSLLAAGFRMWRFEKSKSHMVETSDIITLVQGEFNNLFRVVGVAWQELYDQGAVVKRAPVIGAMFATFNASAKAGLEFWHAVGTGLNLTDKQDPRYQLRRYLESHSLSGVYRRGAAKPVHVEDIYRVCVMAWNKWRKNEKMETGLRTTTKRIKAI
jgi:hypothetical protein